MKQAERRPVPELSAHEASPGISMDAVLWRLAPGAKLSPDLPPHTLRAWLTTLEKRLVRERHKGLARHWSYDLNRHMALKAARDRLHAQLGD